MQTRLERARFRLGAQIINALLPRREHRQHAIDRAGGEHERVVADALARIGHHRARGAIDRLHGRAELEADAACGNALRAGDRRVVGHRLSREHGLRQRRLLVRLLRLVAEQNDVGGNVLLLGGERRRDARRAAADNDDLAHGIHPPPPFGARCVELLTRPRHCA